MAQWYLIPWDGVSGYYKMFPAAYRFLREFGGLRINPDNPHRSELARSYDEFIIDPLITDLEYDMSIYYEWCLETTLFQIGAFVQELHYPILIDISGRVWIAAEQLILAGNNTEEAISNLISGDDASRIIVNMGNVFAKERYKDGASDAIVDAIRQLGNRSITLWKESE